MVMRALLFLVLLLSAVMDARAQRATQQRPEWLRQYSWAQVQQLESRISHYAARDRIKGATLKAIASAVGVSLPNVSFDKLVEIVDAKSREAARFQSEVSDLRAQLQRLPDPSLRDPAVAALSRATAAFEAGRLDEAETEFRLLNDLRQARTQEAFSAWANAMDAQIAIAKLRLRYDYATVLALQKANYAQQAATEAAEMAWRALIEAGSNQQTKAAILGPIEALYAARKIYTEDMPRFLQRYGSEARLYQRKLLLAYVQSAILLRTDGVDAYEEPNKLLEEYIVYARRSRCDECLAYAVSELTTNVSTMIFRSRNVDHIKPIEKYVDEVTRNNQIKSYPAAAAGMHLSLSYLYGMAGEVGRSRYYFDRAEGFAKAAIAAYPSTDPNLISARLGLADLYRQRGEYLKDEAYSYQALNAYKALVLEFAAAKLENQKGLTLKRIGAVYFALAYPRRDCTALRLSQKHVDEAATIINARDFPGEHRGIVQMRHRNEVLMPQFCR